MAAKLFGARIMLGPDGAGLEWLPTVLPEVRNPLDLPLYAGTQQDLEDAAERTVAALRRAGYQVERPIISHRERRWWARPDWQVLIRAFASEKP
ncbi:MAG: hypothetical protein RB148_12005 [Armatimonadota bacterium]|nr:hypothetical protein [Armatimonadota bacterium]